MTFKAERVEVQTTVHKNVYKDVRCDGCNCELCYAAMPCEEDEGFWPGLQPEGALQIKLSGGYGMAIDSFGEDLTPDDLVKLFCSKCLEKLCAQWPCFASVVEAHCSSSIAHHCSKERKFVWRAVSECCSVYCAKCSQLATSFTGERQDDSDAYSRHVVACECGHEGPGTWGWEVNGEVEVLNLKQLEEQLQCMDRQLAAKLGITEHRESARTALLELARAGKLDDGSELVESWQEAYAVYADAVLHEVGTEETEQLYYCSGDSCPGLSWRASAAPHPFSCSSMNS